MASTVFTRHSLKTRITLTSLAIFLFGIWSLAFYAGRMLREDLQRMLGQQLFSTASFIGKEIDDELNGRLRGLKNVAARVTPATMGNTAALQAFLEDRPILQTLFTGSITAYRLDGTAIAEVPISGGRVGVNFMDRDYVASALKGQSTIGMPHLSKRIGNPEFGMAVPILDTQGKLIGVLGGEMDLSKPNFLDKVSENRYGKTGGYILVAPQHRLIVTATDKSRAMTAMPALGINPLFDRYVQGFEGSGTTVDSRGLEVLSSAKNIPVAGWLLIARIPAEEAFAPIQAMQWRILLATIFLTLLAGGLTWWALRRQLEPMLAAVKALATMSNAIQPPQPLTVTRQDEVGELIGGFNRLLEMLANREKALKAREERFRFLFDRASDGIMIMSPSGKLVAANESFARMHGYSVEEMLNMSLNDLDTPEASRLAPARMQRVLSGKSATFEVEHYYKDGHVFPLEVSASLIVSDGETLIQCFHRDITERVQLESQLRESQKMEALGTLAGGVAHDFNNIVAAILGNLELARQDVGPAHPVLESLAEIDKASRRAKDLVQQILAFGRRQGLSRKAILLAPVVEESARLLRTTLTADVTLNIQCAAETPAVLADASQIQQVLLNLCSNAWQAMRGRGHAGVIEVRLEAHDVDEAPHMEQERRSADERVFLRPGRYARLTVSDNGSGMDVATRSHIFEPFFTTKPMGEGTGLGLAVVHGIVQAHEASIAVQSDLGKGTIFRIYFPAVDAAVQAVAEEEPRPLQQNIGDDLVLEGAGKHVLYLDDDEAIVYLMTRLLERKGYRVSGYTDALEALAAVRADPEEFDLAVTDHNMPGMSGLEVATALREIRADLPVAVATGYITDDLRDKSPAAGVRELIFKPTTVAELCQTVARLAQTAGKISKHS